MATAEPPHEAEKPKAPVEQPEVVSSEKPKDVASAEQTDEKAGHQVSRETISAAPTHVSDEKVPVEPQLAPYPPTSASASPGPNTPLSATATTPPPASAISSADTDKISVPPVAMGQYPVDHAPQTPAPMYPEHTGSTSPHQQYTIQPDHAYAQPQPGYDQSQYYAQQQQHPGMPPHQASGGQQFRTATAIANLNRSPAPVDCPACGTRAMTTTSFITGNTTHAWAFGVCICLCLGCIPYLISGTKDVQHKCGKCGVLLATWHRSGSTEVHMHA